MFLTLIKFVNFCFWTSKSSH